MSELEESLRKKVIHSPRPLLIDKLGALDTRREAVVAKLRRIKNALSQGASDRSLTIHHLETYLKRVDSCYDEFNSLQNEVYAMFPNSRDEQEHHIIDFEALYDDIRVEICVTLEPLQRRTNVAPATHVIHGARESQPAAGQPGLPPVPLPKFNGTYENWYRFKQLFQDLIQKYPGMSEGTKLHYLTESLIDKAKNMISEQIIKENNFQLGWKVLEDRFENKRLIIDVHLGGLMNLQRMSKTSSEELRQLVEECSRHVDALEFHGQKMLGMSEQLVISLLTSKLDMTTLSLWESSVKPKELPKYKETLQFLQNRCFVLERCESSTTSKPTETSKLKGPVGRAPVKVHAALQTNEDICTICNDSHNVNKCSVLKQMEPAERWDKVKEKQLCFNCLKRGHRVGKCTSRVCTVAGCGKKHHTQLHSEEMGLLQTEENRSAPQSSEPSVTVTCTSTAMPAQPRVEKQVILSTALVEIKDSAGTSHLCRALLDSGSQSNFLSAHVVNLLRLKCEKVRVPVVGINGERMTVQRLTTTSVNALNRKFSCTPEFLVVPQVTGTIPFSRIDTREWKLPADKLLADPRFAVPAKVDMLLGAELFFELLLPECSHLINEKVTLWNTKLGWIVSGSHTSVKRPAVASVNCSRSLEPSLEILVQRFWEQEELPGDLDAVPEDEQCLKHFADTHRRRDDGRYIVRLPFRNNANQLGNSRLAAEKRFLQLERRLDRQPELKQQYVNFIREYNDLGHCKRVEPLSEDADQRFYLPHHAVLKPTSSTTKLRVVFDASARSEGGLSLNDVLMTGPTLQDNLLAIVLRFRKYRYVFTADVIKMFRQIRVDSQDTRYQSILWREDSKDSLETYELETVTYGTSCALFCAAVCLNQLAKDEAKDFPLAAKVAQRDFYMDDVLSGGDVLDEVVECQSQLIALLKKGGFDLHKWCANVPQLLDNIPEQDREKQTKLEVQGSNDVIKTLGLLWDHTSDVFVFLLNDVTTANEPITKRTVLSATAKIFDPSGVLEPVTVVAKIFIQELWVLQLKWDDPVPTAHSERWRKFTADLQRLNQLSIPRRALADDAVVYELHGFCDASKKAYSACVYLRTIRSNGKVEMHLISSKTRAAPLPKRPGSKKKAKPFTIPRAELCGALLLARLMVKVHEYLDLEVKNVVLWCDSQIVLCWLNKSASSLETYVGNRVEKINLLTAEFEWRYINTKCNPADLASRGLSAAELIQSRLWWNGPSMLHVASYVYFPVEPQEFSDDELELKAPAFALVATEEEPWELLTRYSNFRKLQRVCAYVCRFWNNSRQKEKSLRITGHLTIPELRHATRRIIAQTQIEGFPEELWLLKTEQTTKSKFLQLAPFLDEYGLLRVGGRLENAKVAFDRKHQMLLPRDHHVTRILIETLHTEYCHVGQRGLLAITQQQYWPVRGRAVVRQIIHKCVRCFRMKRAETVQYMGNLPEYRVNPSPPFYRTGIDYAGPFYLRQGKRGASKVKAYVALFICMSTKAMHLELVSDLTTEAFLATLHRFIGRRGCPAELHSDNATNFQGADKELQNLYQLFTSQQTTNAIDRFCAAKEIQWSFIPPRTPNFGGIWEAGVKAAKTLLKPVLCEASLNFEEMNTALVNVEAILNSRPLTQLSPNPTDLAVLTPGHFLIGRELTAVPEPSYSEVRVSSLSRWQHLQKLKQDYWKRWSTEYLSELQPRGKWYKNKLTIRPGMLVVLKEDNVAPQNWRLGRIVRVQPGADNLVRVVIVRTATGEVKRGVSKIAVLPVETTDSLAPVPTGGGCHEQSERPSVS